MGIAGISIWKLAVILALVFLFFGTGKLKNLGSDLGGAIRNFRDSLKDDDKDKKPEPPKDPADADP